MRPVTKRGNHPPYNTATTFSFSGAAASAIRRILPGSTGKNVPIQDCLDAWLRQVKGQKPLGGTVADQTRAVTAIQNRVGGVYKLASVPLTQELGAFCSFCETPLSGLLEVEHCVPKSEYPTFALDWDNFLLSCSPCNGSKGNTPSRSTVQGWLGKMRLTEQDYYQEIRQNHYVWADLESRSYRWLPLSLERYDSVGDTWHPVPMDEAANPDNVLLPYDIAKREVQARICDPHDPTGNTSNDWVVRVVTSGTAPRADEMVRLCRLNENGKLTSTYDRRVMNRTIQWFRTLLVLKNYNVAKGSGTQKQMWEMLLLAAQGAGFYSVWMTILDFHDPALALSFVNDSKAKNYYPNTEPKDLP